MTKYRAEDPATEPTIEVTVFRDGAVVDRILCESDQDAIAVVEQWTEQPGVRCQIDDLSSRHRAGDVLEPEESELDDSALAHDDPGAKR
jgi:hypothetical protein